MAALKGELLMIGSRNIPVNKSRQLQIRVTDPMMEALDDLVVSERTKRPGLGITRVDLVREAIAQFLIKNGYTIKDLKED